MNTNHRLLDLCFRCVAYSETGSPEVNEKWQKLYWAKIGNSGLSFGPIQFDISVSTLGQQCLRDCGLTEDEINELSQIKRTEDDIMGLTIDDFSGELKSIINKTNRLLRNNLQTIVDYSLEYIKKGLTRIQYLEGVTVDIPDYMVLFLLDYHTQFYISKNGRLHNWLKEQSGVLTLDQFMKYKRGLVWYSKPEGKKDTERRLKVIQKFCNLEGISLPKINESQEIIEDSSESENFEIPEWLRI